VIATYATWYRSGLLAPAIVESICVGRQSVSFSAVRLKDHASLPIDWMRSSGFFRTRQFDAINSDCTFLVAPNFIATETNRAELALCSAVGSLRAHDRA